MMRALQQLKGAAPTTGSVLAVRLPTETKEGKGCNGSLNASKMTQEIGSKKGGIVACVYHKSWD